MHCCTKRLNYTRTKYTRMPNAFICTYDDERQLVGGGGEKGHLPPLEK